MGLLQTVRLLIFFTGHSPTDVAYFKTPARIHPPDILFYFLTANNPSGARTKK